MPFWLKASELNSTFCSTVLLLTSSFFCGLLVLLGSHWAPLAFAFPLKLCFLSLRFQQIGPRAPKEDLDIRLQAGRG